MINKKTLCAIAFTALTSSLCAQDGVLTPYSRYGFGQLADNSVGFNKGMGGVAYGLRSNNQINPANPASYSDIDSLTCLFDMGISLENANFDHNGTKLNCKNSSFDYFNMAFRLRKRVGMALGFMPYSNVGYSLSTSSNLSGKDFDESTISSTRQYTGSGGLHQLYIGVGARPIKPLSVGVNAAYLFGNYSHAITNSYSLATAYSTVRYYTADIKALKLDFGAQFTQKIGKKDEVTLGVTYGLKNDIKSSAYSYDQTLNSSSEVVAADTSKVKNAFQMPQTLGIGLSLVHNNRLTIAFDYTLQKWGECRFPGYNNSKYVSTTGNLTDRTRYALGAEWLPTGKNGVSTHFLSHVRYRVGGYYATPYTKVNGADGPKEYGLGFGFGIPIANQWNNRSMLNLSAQWIHVEPKLSGMIKENYLRINIGLTFTETWFKKWKFQ